MIRLTINDFYTKDVCPDAPGDIYLFHDADNKLLYVGESNCVERRLLEHLGMTGRSGPSTIGQVVIRNLPNSLVWTITVYNLNECKDLLPSDVTNQWYDGIWQRGYDRGDRRAVERALIECLHPSVNYVHSSGKTDLTSMQKRGTLQGASLERLARGMFGIKRFYPFTNLDSITTFVNSKTGQ